MTRSWDDVLKDLQRALRERRVSERKAAREMGIASTTLNRLLSGESSEPYARTRAAIEDWIYDASDADDASDAQDGRWAAPHHEDDAATAEALVIDPDLARRLVGQHDPSHWRTRLAIIHVFEQLHIEAGYPPDRWPQWLKELRVLVTKGR